MKRLFKLALALTACALSAGPTDKPAGAEWQSGSESPFGGITLQAGFSGDYSFHNKLKPKDTRLAGTGKLEHTFNGVGLTANVNDVFKVYGQLGFASHKFKIRDASGPNSSSFRTKEKPGYGVGICATFFESDNTSLSAHGFISQLESKLKTVTRYVNGAFDSSSDLKPLRRKFKEQNYTFGVTASHRVENFVPYVGVNYVKTTLKEKVGGINFKNRKKIGAVIGAGFASESPVNFGIQGRFINETALGLTAQYNF